MRTACQPVRTQAQSSVWRARAGSARSTLSGAAMMLRIRAEHATVAGQRTEEYATTGAQVEDHSGVGRNLQRLGKAALWASEKRLRDHFTRTHAAPPSRISFTHDSAAIAAGKPVVGMASSTTWRMAAAP